MRLRIGTITKRRLATAGIILVCYTLFASLYLPQTILFNSQTPNHLPWLKALARNYVPSYIWAALTPLALWFSSRFPIGGKRWPRNVAIHFPLSICLSAAQSFGYLFLIAWIITGRLFSPLPGLSFMASMLTNGVVFYWTIIAIHHAISYFRKYRDREYRLVQAQLQALKAQLHPHFLFNTLNAITELVYRDPKAADRTISELSDLLRVALYRGDAEEVRLRDELEFLTRYIAIQKTLLQDRLSVEMKIDPDSLDASVPNLILQPIVENAIRHGVDPRASQGHIEIRAARSNGHLQLSVSDDGPGLPASTQAGATGGIGLANTRARLEHLYGASHSFKLTSLPGRGVTVSMEIPFRESAADSNYETSYSDN